MEIYQVLQIVDQVPEGVEGDINNPLFKILIDGMNTHSNSRWDSNNGQKSPIRCMLLWTYSFIFCSLVLNYFVHGHFIMHYLMFGQDLIQGEGRVWPLCHTWVQIFNRASYAFPIFPQVPLQKHSGSALLWNLVNVLAKHSPEYANHLP